jgi:hypothetical protein
VRPEILVAGDADWFLGSAARRLGLDCSDVVLTIGTRGPTQKVLARLIDGSGRVAAVAKIGQQPPAVRRVRHESAILESLSGRGVPAVLGTEVNGDSCAVFMSHIDGTHVPATRWPSPLAEAFLSQLPRSGSEAFEDHPILELLGGVDVLSPGCADRLSDRRWARALVHGDFAPWNMLIEKGTGKLFVVDWEHARPEGLPHLDVVFYVLQVSYLLWGDSPGRALDSLAGCPEGALAEVSEPERVALAEVAARLVLAERASDGVSPGTDECVWWAAIRDAAAASLAVGQR